METIVNAWQSIPSTFWVALGASGFISVVLQFIKHYLDQLSPKLIIVLLTTFSFVASGIDYLLGVASNNPTILGQRTATLVGFATILYRFVISPGYKLLIDAKNYRESESVTVAASGIVTGTPSITVGAPIATLSNEASF